MLKLNHKRKFLNILTAFLAIAGVKTPAHAELFPDSFSSWLQTTPRTQSAQTLTPFAYPHEAELFCSLDNCIFGLTHELVVGGDVVGMIAAPMRRVFDANWVSGSSLYIIDAFGGFQILRDVQGNNMNAQIGFRKIYLNGNSNQISTQGITTAVNYSTTVSESYEQGVQFSGYFTIGNAYLSSTNTLDVNDPGHDALNTDASYFYRVSQTYPTFRVSFPAQLEIVNWDSDHTGLKMPLRLYGLIEPFYIQNNLNFAGSNLSLQEREQNFGARLASTVTYESSERQKSFRYALKAGLGMDIASSQFTVVSSGTTNLGLPNRLPVALYAQLAGSFQF